MADIIQQLEAAEAIEKPFDASDPKQVNEARKRAGRGKKKEREVVAALMQHPDGRKVLYDSTVLVLQGNPVVTGDPYSTYFNLGQEHRAKALFLEIIKVAPQDFIKMMDEYGQ